MANTVESAGEGARRKEAEVPEQRSQPALARMRTTTHAGTRARIHTRTHTRAHTHAHTARAHAKARARHAHPPTQACTHLHTRKAHAHTHARAHAAHPPTQARTHLHTRKAHAHTHARAHGYGQRASNDVRCITSTDLEEMASDPMLAEVQPSPARVRDRAALEPCSLLRTPRGAWVRHGAG
jgi:hypothetical protein